MQQRTQALIYIFEIYLLKKLNVFSGTIWQDGEDREQQEKKNQNQTSFILLQRDWYELERAP